MTYTYSVKSPFEVRTFDKNNNVIDRYLVKSGISSNIPEWVVNHPYFMLHCRDKNALFLGNVSDREIENAMKTSDIESVAKQVEAVKNADTVLSKSDVQGIENVMDAVKSDMDRLRDEARELGIKRFSTMNEDTLRVKIAEAKNK